jgi:hypothetical protein
LELYELNVKRYKTICSVDSLFPNRQNLKLMSDKHCPSFEGGRGQFVIISTFGEVGKRAKDTRPFFYALNENKILTFFQFSPQRSITNV